ncbi:MAG: J domain-containing protein [Anaerolinea sp.]|nr:J domain-containing protein [Anaerolinea sp.]
MTWYETIDEKLARLRAELAQAQDELIEAEAELADQKADIAAFEYEYNARAGYLLDKLAALEDEVKHYLDRIKLLRNKRIFGTEHVPVEEQYRRVWQQPPPPPPPPPQPSSPATEAQIKKLYRQLARRCHPDLGTTEADRAWRTQIMAAINDAYAARSMTELLAIARQVDAAQPDTAVPSGQTAAEMLQVLEAEIGRCRRRLREIDLEMTNLHQHHLVELMLEVKFARKRGRDVLGEMAQDLTRKVARKEAERDMLKTQFESMGLGGSIR